MRKRKKLGRIAQMVVEKNLSPDQAKRLLDVLLAHARKEVGDDAVRRNRWQSGMARRLSGVISQQSLSLVAKGGNISESMARAVLQRLGEDPEAILYGTLDDSDPCPARARVLARVEDFYPVDAVSAVRAISPQGRADWTEAEWMLELVSAHSHLLMRK